jgi:WD40 repeat protein
LAAGRDRHASDLAFANNVIALKLGRLYSVGGRDVPPVETCPYQGLAAFDRDDSACFFGREQLVGELAARTVQAGLLGVVGASGSGKSSVIAAGLLPSLAAGLLPGSERWAQVSLRPGEHPMAELRAVLPDQAGDPLAAAARDVPGGGRLVLVVDQFEETFTLCAGEAERAAFIGALTGAAARCPDRVAVILAIRGDYYAHCAPYPELAAALAANHVLVGPLTPDQLRRAIELPARRSGLRVESALSDALVAEVAGQPGGLPLLSTALVELWQARESGWLRLDAHQRTGGVRGAVSRLAEASYQQLPDTEREAARRVLLRLVAAGEGEAVTRRRVPVEEFDPGRDAAAAGVLARLTQDRLLTTGDGTVEVAHEALLREWPRLRGWLADDAQGRQLRTHLTQVSRQWQAGGNEPSELYRGARLSAALDWSAGHAADLNQLERDFLAASRQASERDADRQRRANRRLRGLLTGVAALLVLALAAGALALAQRASARRSARDAQRSATVALAQSLGAQAVSEPRIDLAMLLARAAVALHPSLRTRSDLLATLLRVPTALRTLHWNTNRNLAVALSPDGRTIAIEDNNGNTVVEEAATGRRIGTLQADILAFGPDGSLLTAFGGTATGGHNGIEVHDPATLQVTRIIPFPRWARRPNATTARAAFGDGGARMAVVVALHKNSSSGPVTASARIVQYGYPSGRAAGPTITVRPGIVGVAYAAGGRRLVVVAPGATIVFDARTGRRLRSYPVGGISAAVSPDGGTAGIGGADGSVRFLDLATGRVTLGTGAHTGGAVLMSFTPDGKTLITSGNDGKTLVWDVAAHTIRQTLAGHAGPIHAQAISADGATLYTGSFDANVLAWDLTGHRGLVPSFAAQTDPSLQTFSLAISPDGTTAAVGSTSGVVNLWDLRTLRRIQGFQAVPGMITALSFGPGGRSLLVAAENPHGPAQVTRRAWLRIWVLGPHPRLLRSMRGLQGIAWATWSPDGKTVAAVGAQRNQNPLSAGVVAEWDASTGRPLGPPVVVHGGAPSDVSFAPHGDTVAVTGFNGVTEVLDPARRTVQSRFTAPGYASFGVTFSPNGSQLATSDWSGAVDLWNPKTGKLLGQIPDPSQSPTSSVAWSPDGRTIAVTDGDGTLRLFDVATRQEIGPPFPLALPQGPQANAYATYAAFTPDGANVVVTTYTGRTWIFPATLQAWEARACAVANRNLTRPEWQQYLPGTPYRQLCPATPGTLG